MDWIRQATLSDEDLVSALAAADRDGTDTQQVLTEAVRARLECVDLDRVLAMLATALEAPESSDGVGYWLCITELKGRSTDETVRACGIWAESPDPAWRATAADIITNLAEVAGPIREPLRRAARPIIERLLEDDDAGVVAAAVGALGYICRAPRTRDEDALLLRFETHPDEDVRWRLVHCLSAGGSPSDIPALIRLTVDPASHIRDWATFALGIQLDADTPEIRAALLARLDDDDADTRGEAMRGLAVRQDRRAVPYICRELDREDVDEAVIEAAGVMPDPSFLPALEDLLGDLPDDEDVQAAVEACRTGVTSPRWSAED